MKKKNTNKKTPTKVDSPPQAIQTPNESILKTLEAQKNPQAKIELIDPEIFIEAAERLLEAANAGMTSSYCCDHINQIAEKIKSAYWGSSEELWLFKNLYEYERKETTFNDLAWWPRLKGGFWDYDSRIFALLFAAEFAQSEQS